MKTKLHQRRLEHNLNHARRVFNEAIFAVERIPKGKQTFEDIIGKIRKDFFQSAQRIMFAQSFDEENPHICFGPTTDPQDSKEEVLKKYLKFFRENCPTGPGFTPRLALSKEFGSQGYNCLGKAMAFASFANQYKMETELAFSTDHAMCICYDEHKMYLCDPGSGSLWKMNGMVCEHEGYGWYKKVSGDEFRFNCLVVRSVSYGGWYSIVRTCEFLKRTPWDHTVDVPEDAPFEIGLLGIMNPSLPYRKLIQSLNWESMIHEFFPNLDEYEKDYRTEWLLEIECVREYRTKVDVESNFDKAFFHAICATHFNGTLGEFNQQTIPVLKMAPTQVLTFLESGHEIRFTLPKKPMIFLRTLRETFEKDAKLKEYALEKMRTRLLDTTVND